MWCIGARTFNHAGQNTNSSIESYHGVNLKADLSADRKTGLTRDLQWFLYRLKTVVLPGYEYKLNLYYCSMIDKLRAL